MTDIAPTAPTRPVSTRTAPSKPVTLMQVQSAATFKDEGLHRLLVIGSTGAGKTAQIWSLPGRKFAYLFDPAAMATLKGCPNLDFVQLIPDPSEVDMTLKGFNKDSKSDAPREKKEPVIYRDWVEDINARSDASFFASYDWLCIDSITFLIEAMMDRQLFINNRFGEITDRADYRVTGNKLVSLFRVINTLPINIYCTGHIDTYQDEDTKRIVTQLRAPGRSRGMLPLSYSNIWLAKAAAKDKYTIRTIPEERGGFQDIRTTIRGLDADHDVTIKDFANATRSGIGGILTTKAGFKPKQQA